MSARSFFYASAGIFLLVAAYTLGARTAKADLDRTAGMIVGFSDFQGINVLRSDGTQWLVTIGSSPEWRQQPLPPIPVPLEDVLFWGPEKFVTRDGHAWGVRWDGSQNQWVRTSEPIPLPTVSVEGKTWSGVKEGYRK